ncbi:hypothetical protein AAF712_000676 [Marasmius tenuissimus]|uniref:PLC-like phosphodiesterase n=1 Tax=Marasmius tenuissimus TaxID=585030 RepID=A0ABR3AFK2_9AGAR|nr:hypothetical protein PM082_002509 [Marasmius tenuissimus]
MFPLNFLTRRPALVAIASLLLSADAASVFSASKRATTCNGYNELCERSYGNVTFVGAHDSYAIGNITNAFVNQDQDVTTQLNDGIRMLQMQAHENNGVITLCHSSCSLSNGGTLEDYLKKVKTWMDGNPNEVLTLLIVNIQNLPASRYDTVFKATGLDQISFVPESSPLTATAWPTLGSLIDKGTRLITFLDNQADSSSAPYLIDEFTNMWETEFNVVDIARFDCSVNRTKGDASTQLFTVNHFFNQVIATFPAPFPAKANVTNAATGEGSVGVHVGVCQSKMGRSPNFLLLDFYEFAGTAPFEVAAAANGLTYNGKSIASPRSSSNSSGSGSNGGSGSGNNNNGAFGMKTPGLLSSVALTGFIGGLFAVLL